MFLNKLELEGFRSIKFPLELEFQEGLTMFQGNNGLGKSSILKALRLLLFDKTDSKLEEYVNDKSNFFKLALEFEHNAVSYKTTMIYDLKKNSTSRELFINDFETPKVNTTSSVVDFLKELFDPNLSYHAIALMQNSSEILKVKDSERLDLFKKIRDIDYTKQAEELKVEINQLEDSLKETSLKIDFLSNKNYDFEELRKLPLSEEDFKKITSDIKTLEAKIASIESLKNSFERLLKEKNSYEEKIKNLTSSKEKNEEHRSNALNKVEYLDRELGDFDEKFSSLEEKSKEELVNLTSKHEESLKQIDSSYTEEESLLNKSLAEVEEELKSLPEIRRLSIIDYPSDISSSKEKLYSKKADAKSLENLIEAHKSGGVCPTCGQEFKKEIAEDQAVLLSEITEECFQLEKEIAKFEVLLSEQEKLVEEQRVTQDKKKNFLERKEALKEKLQSLEKNKMKDISSEESSFNKNKEIFEGTFELKKKQLEQEKDFLHTSRTQQLEKISSLENEEKSLKEDIEKASKDLESIETEISNIDIPDSEEEEKLIEVKKDQLNSYNESLSQNTLIEERNERIKKEKEEDKKVLNSLVKDRDKFSSKIMSIKEARTILLKHFPNFIIQETIGDTEASINNFIETVYNKPLNISLRSTSTSLKIEYGDKDRKRNCKNLSGAEEILVSLGFIHTLNEQIGLGFIALDEADQSLSEENTEKLFEIIQNMEYEQILIITHNKLMQSKLLNEGAHVYEFYEEGKVREANV